MFDSDITEEELHAKAELRLITASMLIDFIRDAKETSEASTTLKNICIDCSSNLLMAHVFNTAFAYMQEISKLISREEQAIKFIGDLETIASLTEESDQAIMRIQAAIALLRPQIHSITAKTRQLASIYEQMKKEHM